MQCQIYKFKHQVHLGCGKRRWEINGVSQVRRSRAGFFIQILWQPFLADRHMRDQFVKYFTATPQCLHQITVVTF